MKRAIAAAVTVLTASASIGLVGATAAYAKPKPKMVPPNYNATIKVEPKWTYPGVGKLAVFTNCTPRTDRREITSSMLPHSVMVPGAGRLLIKVTDHTKPGKYAITLWCVDVKGKHHTIDALAESKVKIVLRLPPFKQPKTPALPKHFKPNATISSGPAPKKHDAVAKHDSHGKK